MEKKITKEDVRAFIDEQNDDILQKLLMAAKDGEDAHVDAFCAAAREVAELVELLVGRMPKMLNPMYAFALETLLAGMMGGNPTKEMVGVLHGLIDARCITVRPEGLENED